MVVLMLFFVETTCLVSFVDVVGFTYATFVFLA